MGVYICNTCNYTSPKKSHFDAHCTTIRHLKLNPVDPHAEIKNLKKQLAERDARHHKELAEKNHTLAEKDSELASKTQELLEVCKMQQINITVNHQQTNIYIKGMYFNRELEYYPELIKIMGVDEAHHYLLHSLGRNPFDVLKKIYIEGPLPILRDDDSFVICRSESDYEMDPTGDVVDRENKEKVDNAVIMASTNANDPSTRLEVSRKRVKTMAHPKKHRDELVQVPKIIVIPKLRNTSKQPSP